MSARELTEKTKQNKNKTTVSACCHISNSQARSCSPLKKLKCRWVSSQRRPHGSAMDASTDSTTARDPGKTPVVSGAVTSLPDAQRKASPRLAQTCNGSQIMNSHDSGSGGSLGGASGPGAAKSGAASPCSVIQTQSVPSAAAQPAIRATGPPVTLVRPPAQTAGSGAPVIGNNSGVCATGHPGLGSQSPLVNNPPSSQPVSASAGSHVIKAEPPATVIARGAIGAVRMPLAVAGGPGGIRGPMPQMLAPRLPQTNPGQPSIGLHNIQLPPGE